MNCAAYVNAFDINPTCTDKLGGPAPGPVDTETFWYYPGLTGTLTEVGGPPINSDGDPLVLDVFTKIAPFQVGVGASNANEWMGASGWMEGYTWLDGPCDPNGRYGGMNDAKGCFIEYHGDMNLNLVPEPAAFWLFGSGLAGLGFIGARRRRKASG